MKTEDVIRFDSILPDKKRCILSRQSPWQKRWSFVVMLLAVYNCLWLPIEIAFEPAAAKSIFMVLLNYFADLCFFIDIPITFRTSALNENGDETTDPKVIAKLYLKGSFTIDFLSVVPLDLLGKLLFRGSDG